MCRWAGRCIQLDNVVFAGAWATVPSSGTPITELGIPKIHVTVSLTMRNREWVRGPKLRNFCWTTKGRNGEVYVSAGLFKSH